MVPAYAMVLLSQKCSTGNGRIAGCSFILSVGRLDRVHEEEPSSPGPTDRLLVRPQDFLLSELPLDRGFLPGTL